MEEWIAEDWHRLQIDIYSAEFLHFNYLSLDINKFSFIFPKI